MDLSIDLTAPSTSGTYYYGACLDAESGESDTGNNCSSSVAVTVANRPPKFTEGDTATRAWQKTPRQHPRRQPDYGQRPNNDSIGYSLSGTAAASFRIRPGTGQLVNHAALDSEAGACMW